MLRIFQTKSVEAAKGYYAKGLREGDYYTQGDQGTWHGKTSTMLDLEGEVTREQFNMLCDNLRPNTGGKLNPRDDVDRKVGYDMTFCAPKSVSIMHGVLGDERILDVFHASVRATMSDIEADSHVRVRVDGQVSQRRTANLLWAEFTHFTARPVDGVSDPALHCHCYCFNTSFDHVEDRFKAGEFFNIKRDAPYYEALFHSRLAMGLRNLGYGIEAKRFGFEIMGIGEENLRRFSRRSQEIENMAELLGISGNDKAKDRLASRTRISKSKNQSWAAMRREWRERIDRSELRYPDHYGKSSGVSAHWAVQLAIETGLERQSVIQHRRLLAQALKFSLGACSVEEIHKAATARSDLICHERNQTLYATTESVLREEEEIIRFLKRTRGLGRRIAGSGRLETIRLDSDQIEAAQAILNSTDRVIVIEGKAGTGKTSMMKAAVAAMESSGLQVFTFAPTSQASHEVLRSEGFSNSETIQQLLVSQKLQQSVKDGVLWVDEAGLLSVGEMDRLFQIADDQDARIVLSGDRFQHHSVQRGDGLRLVAGSGLVEVKQTRTIYRQRKDLYRQAIGSISKGAVESGVGILEQLSAIHESVGFEEQLQQVAEEYVSSLKKHSSVLVVSPTHFEGQLLTQRIRQLMKLSGALGDEEKLIPVHRSRNLTTAERAMPQFFSVGDVVRFHQNAKGGFRKGEVYEISSIEQRAVVMVKAGETSRRLLNLDAAQHYGVFRSESLPIAIGDKLRILKNITSSEGSRLYNGSVYEVTAFQGDEMILNGKHRVRADSGIFDHGYVSTSHSSQGKTCDKVIISQSSNSLGASSAEQFYVSASRGRDEISIWTDNKADLLESVMKSDQRLLASEFVGIRADEKEMPRNLILEQVEEIEMLGFCDARER